MRKNQGFLIIGLILLLSATSCLAIKRNYLSKEEVAWLRENGDDLKVLFGYQAPPDAFTNSLGRYDGLLVDYFRELESVLNISIPMEIFPAWKDIVSYSKTMDKYIIVGAVQTEERDKNWLFTEPFFRHRFILITNRTVPLRLWKT